MADFSVSLLLLSGAIFTLICYTVVKSFIQYRRLRQFKGPFWACVSPFWLFRVTAQGRLYAEGAEVLEKYGSPARIAPNKLITDDPELLRHMSAARSPFTRGTWYQGMALAPNSPNVLSEMDESHHNALRSKLIRGYSGKDIPSLEADIDSQVLELVALIRRETSANRPVDLARSIQYFALDVMTKLAFGEPFGYLKKNEDVYDYHKMTSAFLPVLELGCNFPNIHKLLFSKVVQAIAAPKGSDSVGMGAVIGIAQKAVGERYSPGAKQSPDMMGSFFKNDLTQKQAEDESLMVILAGADSSATAMRMTLLYLLTNPAAYAKLVKEIDSCKSGPLIISSAESRQRPYLQAVIKEGLRMWPPLNGLASKRSPPEGITFNGLFIPGGVEIGWNSNMTQQHKEIYGHDAKIFRPERWIEAASDPERLSKMERTLEIIFGSGRYSCLGKNIALMELDKVYAALLRSFEFGLVNTITPVTTRCHGIHVQNDMWVWTREREE